MNFIRVNMYPRYYLNKAEFETKGNRVEEATLKVTSAYIRLDAFIQIGDLVEFHTCKSFYNEENTGSFKAARCFLTRSENLGINGAASDIYIDEDSYDRLLVALGLKAVKVNISDMKVE